jgi:hypothetical protein
VEVSNGELPHSVVSARLTEQRVKIPPGTTLITHEDGTLEVIANGERLSKTVAFRVSPSEYVELIPLFETFTNGSVTQAMRWLLQEDEVRRVIADRVGRFRSPA